MYRCIGDKTGAGGGGFRLTNASALNRSYNWPPTALQSRERVLWR